MTAAWNAFPMLDRLFDDVMTGVAGTSFGTTSPVRSFSPAIDVRANEEEIVFTADVPGLKHEDLEITLDDGVLTIKGQRKYEGNGKDKVWLGRSYGSFSRAFTLPDTVDPERLSADLADGVLTVRVAQQPKAKPRKITIAPRRTAPQLSQEPPAGEGGNEK
ncbi:MAG TPA: HSP20 family small heat-shock protein [Labilithrix sp.]|nr:HSP20 family small heat-shock protein [Labilithrix sp.]